jgi:coenzyme F420-reducing hydrogenase delta subunit
MQYPPSVRIIEVPCSGRVDAVDILHTFEQGADGVIVAG